MKRRAAAGTSHGHVFVSRAKGEKRVVHLTGLLCQSLGEMAASKGPVGEPAREARAGSISLLHGPHVVHLTQEDTCFSCTAWGKEALGQMQTGQVQCSAEERAQPQP